MKVAAQLLYLVLCVSILRATSSGGKTTCILYIHIILCVSVLWDDDGNLLICVKPWGVKKKLG